MWGMKTSLSPIPFLVLSLLFASTGYADSTHPIQPDRLLNLQVHCARQFLQTAIASRQFVELNDGFIGLRAGPKAEDGYFKVNEGEAFYVAKDPNRLEPFRWGTLDRLMDVSRTRGSENDLGEPADIEAVNELLEKQIRWSIERTAINVEVVGTSWWTAQETAEGVRTVFCGCQTLPAFEKQVRDLLKLKSIRQEFIRPVACEDITV